MDKNGQFHVWKQSVLLPKQVYIRAAAAVVGKKEGEGPLKDYYDRIITGDLGKVGQQILIDLLKEKGFSIEEKHMDCGIEIYDADNQGTEAGGSGCGCAATVLAAYILPQIESGEWKRVLFVPTGALLSKTSFNEGKSVPGIAHGVVIESLQD